MAINFTNDVISESGEYKYRGIELTPIVFAELMVLLFDGKLFSRQDAIDGVVSYHTRHGGLAVKNSYVTAFKHGTNRFLSEYVVKVSYWADTKVGAIGEVRKWNHDVVRNRLIFMAYDDLSSTFPMMGVTSRLRIIDGRSLGFEKILEKDSKNKRLSQEDQQLVDVISAESPDGLVYKSHTKPGHVNFLFFESGFNKLALRSVGLWLDGRKRRLIECAYGSDYSPDLEHYGDMFMRVAKVKADVSYLFTEEYLVRKRNYEQSVRMHK